MVVAAAEAGDTKGWTFTVFEEVFLYGFPHKMRHFTPAMPGEEELMETGDDGQSTLEIIYAAYESAAG